MTKTIRKFNTLPKTISKKQLKKDSKIKYYLKSNLDINYLSNILDD